MSSRFVAKNVSDSVCKFEIDKVLAAKQSFPNFEIKTSRATNEVSGLYEEDDVQLGSTYLSRAGISRGRRLCIYTKSRGCNLSLSLVVLRMPACYPLRPIEMEIDKRIGISDTLWRKWTLSMATVLLTQDGNILEAIMLWKQSLDKHFEGVEVCPICYSGTKGSGGCSHACVMRISRMPLAGTLFSVPYDEQGAADDAMQDLQEQVPLCVFVQVVQHFTQERMPTGMYRTCPFLPREERE